MPLLGTDKKPCIRCKIIKPTAMFYEHPSMADGHLNKCKECCKKESADRRRANLGKFREYDNKRKECDKRKASRSEHSRAYRKRHPEKYKSHTITNNAIRGGKLIKRPCEVCGNANSEAHHEDYSKPLEVKWVCRKCHCKLHDNYIE
jgi:hypothetical protein